MMAGRALGRAWAALTIVLFSAAAAYAGITPSVTVVIGSPNPSLFGQSVTFTATVSGGSGTPTGTVTFSDGIGNPIGTGTLNPGGIATFTTNALAVGTHNIIADYSGDPTYATSSGTTGQTVDQDPTATAVASSANPSVFGQPVTFTATVSSTSPGSGTPTGTVTFFIDATVFAVPVNGSGQATLTTSSLTVGSHTVVATYSGDGNFIPSSATLSGGQTVGQATSTTVLAPSVNPSTLGQSVSFSATVSGTGGTPTGTVTFLVDGNPLASAALNGAGQVTFTTNALTLGPHSIVATYSGDATFLASSATITQNVNPGVVPTTTVLSTSINPSLASAQAVFNRMLTDIQFLRQFPQFSGPWVLVNPWAIFDRRSEVQPGDYTNGPHHPFNRAVNRAVNAGHDVLFCAGNCGRFCSDQRCGPRDRGPGQSIFGANSHPRVMSVGAVRTDARWLGYSSEGPGQPNLAVEKPDFCAPSDFSETADAYTANTGTSAACGVTAGAVAALRSHWARAQTLPPDMLRVILTLSARKTEGPGWNGRLGNGVLNLEAALSALATVPT